MRRPSASTSSRSTSGAAATSKSTAGGEIRAYHGIVNRWLLVVYAILGVWGVYYLVRYWGGLGPGLPR